MKILRVAGRGARAVWRPVGEVLFGRKTPRAFYGDSGADGANRSYQEGEIARARVGVQNLIG